MKVDFYKEVSNFISNELGIGRPEMIELISEIAQAKLKDTINKFADARIEQIVREEVQKKLKYHMQYGADRYIKEVIREIFDEKYSLTLKDKVKK